MPTTKLGNRTLMLMFVGAGLASGIAAVLFHDAIVASRHLVLDRALRATGLTRGALLIAVPTLTGWKYLRTRESASMSPPSKETHVRPPR